MPHTTVQQPIELLKVFDDANKLIDPDATR
jgi:hypothetical protein